MKTAVITIALIASVLSACSEISTAYYPTHDAAVSAGAVQRGWLPAWVPATAKDIYEQHDIDTNDVWVRFYLPKADRADLIANLKQLSQKDIEKIKPKFPSSAKWWFHGLIQQTPADDGALNADIYATGCYGNRNGYIAIDRLSLNVYFWCTP